MLRIAQITDCHLTRIPHERVYGVDTEATLEAVCERVRQWQPDLVLATGDLADDGAVDTYRRLRGILSELGCPVLVVPGNHDDPDTMRTHLLGGPIRWPTRTAVDGWQLIGLDTHDPGEHGGRLSEAALETLAQELSTGPALVYLHHPPIPIGSALFDAMALAEPQPLLTMLTDRGSPTLICCGHVHQRFEQLTGDIQVMTTPSTCSQATPGLDRFIPDELGPGFRWFELEGERARTGVERIGRPAHQISGAETG